VIDTVPEVGQVIDVSRFAASKTWVVVTPNGSVAVVWLPAPS
jgi:hypothetical protein